MSELDKISKSIWGEDYSPSIERVEKVKEMFDQFEFKDLLTYNFRKFRMAPISEFLLATFEFWKNWSLNDWK